MAIGQSDGSIVLDLTVNDQGLKKETRNLKSEAAKLAAEYRKAGMSQSEAFKKAWSEIERTKASTDKVTVSTKKFGQQSQTTGTQASAAIAKIGLGLKSLLTYFIGIQTVFAAIRFSGASAELATQTEASVQRLVDIYGSASDSVGDFIDANSRALGMSKAAAASFSSVYGNLFSVWADQATNAELTNRYLNMTAVVASKTGRTVEDVQERVRSGLLGNTEAIEDLGIFVNVKTIEMTDAFQRMANGKSWEQLDAYTQQQIRSMAILEQATAKYGDEVADTSATIRNRYKAAYEDFQNSWGNIVNTILLPVLEMMTQIFDIVTKGLNALSGRSGQILENVEIQEENTDKTAENIEQQTENQEELNKAVKKGLAGFDEINTLSKDAAESQELLGGVGGVGGANTPLNIETEEAETRMSIFAQKVLKFIEPITKAVDSLRVAFSNISEPLKDLWNDALKPIVEDFGGWITSIVEQTGVSFDYFAEKIKEYKEEITMVIQGISEIIQTIWAVAGPIINSVIQGIGSKLKTTIDFIFSIIQALGNLFGAFKNIFSGIKSLIKGDTEEATNYFKKALANIVNIFVGVGNGIISVINNLWSLIFDAFNGTVNAIGSLVSKIGSWLGFDWDLKWDAKAPLIPEIPKYVPKLAQGTVVPPNREFMAVLGDNKREPEIVSPISTMKQAFLEALQVAGGNMAQDNRPIVLQIDGREIARATREGNASLGSQTVFGGFANAY